MRQVSTPFADRSVASTGQRLCLAVHGGDPAADSLDPLVVIHAAHIRDVHEGAARSQTVDGGAFQRGLFHLSEACRCLAEHEHDLRYPLIGGEAQRRGGCGQRVILRRGQVVRQRPVFSAVYPVGDLIGAGEVVGAGHHGVQTHLCRQGNSDR